MAILNTGTSRREKAMQLMRTLFLFTAKHNVILMAPHIPGVITGQLMHCLGIKKIPSSCRWQGHGGPLSNPSRAPRSAAAPTSGLDLSKLDKVAADLMAKRLVKSIRRAYRSAQTHFIKFCAEAKLTPVPALKEVLCLFVTHLHVQHLNPLTGMSGISRQQRIHRKKKS